MDITLHHYIAHIIGLVGVSYCGLKTYLLMIVTYDIKHGKISSSTENYYSNLSENIESGCLNHSMMNNDTYPMLDMSSSSRDNHDWWNWNKSNEFSYLNELVGSQSNH